MIWFSGWKQYLVVSPRLYYVTVFEINMLTYAHIPNAQKSYESYLTGNRPMNSVFLNPVTENEIKDVLNKLNSKKITGHDGISN